MQTFIAIDSGGTNTRCWVADENGVSGRASCGSVKAMVVGERVATELLQQAYGSHAAERISK
jgi:glucosamine kinase